MNNRPGLGVGEIESPSFGLTDEFCGTLDSVNNSSYNQMRLLSNETGWNNSVERVAVILSASRSGSSLIFNALTESGDIIAPAGEHEPWLFMSGNKWSFTPSDQMGSIRDKDRLLELIRNDLLVRDEQIAGSEASELLWNRAVTRRLEKKQSVQDIVHALGAITQVDGETHQKASELINAESNRQRPATSLDHIDDDGFFLPIENPPFIDQPLARRAKLTELASKTLLFKSPADAYRPGFYEALFPNADITYIHLTRGFAQTVNGLMDGWSKNDTDFISNPLGLVGNSLDITGYSDTEAKKAYWCFDLFPGWEKFTDVSLAEVCAQQWVQAHSAIMKGFPIGRQVSFESFYTDRQRLHHELAESIGVDLHGYNWSKEVMSTEKPGQFRWMKRAELFRNIGRHLTARTLENVVSVQEELGYSMEESTWH